MLGMLEARAYKVAEPDDIETPAMLVFADQLDNNIGVVAEMAGGAENLIVHVKTHKSAAVAHKQLAAGVAGFKCATLTELEMVLAIGAQEAILAYPMVQKIKVQRFAELAQGEAAVSAIVSDPAHVRVLGAVASERGQALTAMIDIDAGMHRTGVAPERAADLYREIARHPQLEPGGFHIYDGHEHFTDEGERQAAAQRHIDGAQQLKGVLVAEGIAVPRIVGGSTFSFAHYARTEGMHGSPGTCIYWDTGYGGLLQDWPFEWAALVLTQVIDRHAGAEMVTTDLGLKAISDDGPLPQRATLLQKPDAEMLGQNEEHGIFRWPEPQPEIGSYLLAVPRHVCPTTIRYPGSYVIDGEGQIADYYPHTSRDRH
ncbi:MAG: hypothetical protein CME20_25595 [Gemmatimonadetes bacterium]|nr:hypothetical protein [Gemmatimonadota bacterium]